MKLICKRVIKWSAFIFSMFFVFTSCLSFAGEPEDLPQIQIYFIPWDIETRVMQSEEDIRKNYFVKVEILDGLYAYGFLESLKINDLKKISNPEPINVRLVIDVKYLHETKTFLSDGNKLYNLSGVMGRNVDDNFRNRFQAITGDTRNIQNPPIKHSPK